MSSWLQRSEVDVNCLHFHPTDNLLVSALITGRIDLYKFEGFETGLVKRWSNEAVHTESVRTTRFSPNGNEILSGSSDTNVALTEVESSKVKWVGKGHKNSISSACFIEQNVIATGDDEGEIRIWDIRQNNKSTGILNEFQECVTDLLVGNKELISSSGDQVGIFDYKKLKLRALSDNIEQEILTISLVKDNKKMICGTNSGSICLFSYGFWGDFNDLIPVNKETAKVTEDVVCACGDDGEVYVVQILPNKVLGKLKEHKNSQLKVKSAESVTINFDRTLLSFVANLDCIFVLDDKEIRQLIDKVQPDFFDEI